MTDRLCINPDCRQPIKIMIRSAESTCSLDCDRALGTGKYFIERVEAVKKRKKSKKKAVTS